jgi:nicotinate-nucleotide adenylyltransferase
MIGLLGGSFDPIHQGHLQLAQLALRHLALTQLLFIPCKQPVLAKKNNATEQQRCEMIQLAIASIPLCHLDQRELNRTTPSYTLDTLIQLRQIYPETPLVFIMGSDAFSQLDLWYRWQTLIEYTHFWVVQRPGNQKTLRVALLNFVKKHRSDHKKLLSQPSGCVILNKFDDVLAISSSVIRKQLHEGRKPIGLPNAVLEYIYSNHLYRSC